MVSPSSSWIRSMAGSAAWRSSKRDTTLRPSRTSFRPRTNVPRRGPGSTSSSPCRFDSSRYTVLRGSPVSSASCAGVAAPTSARQSISAIAFPSTATEAAPFPSLRAIAPDGTAWTARPRGEKSLDKPSATLFIALRTQCPHREMKEIEAHVSTNDLRRTAQRPVRPPRRYPHPSPDQCDPALPAADHDHLDAGRAALRLRHGGHLRRAALHARGSEPDDLLGRLRRQLPALRRRVRRAHRRPPRRQTRSQAQLDDLRRPVLLRSHRQL